MRAQTVAAEKEQADAAEKANEAALMPVVVNQPSAQPAFMSGLMASVMTQAQAKRGLAGAGQFVASQKLSRETSKVSWDAASKTLTEVTDFSAGDLIGETAGDMERMKLTTVIKRGNGPAYDQGNSEDIRVRNTLVQGNISRAFNQSVTTGLTVYRPTPEDY